MSNEELVLKIQAGDDRKDLLEQLYTNNLGIIRNIVQRYSGVTDLDDLMQEAFFGIVKAAYQYDPERGAFTTYAGYWIHAVIRKYLESNGRTIRIPAATQSLIFKYRKIQEMYQKTMAGDPDPEYAAALLGVSKKTAERIIDESRILRIISLDTPIREDKGITYTDAIPDISDEGKTEETVIDKIQNEELKEVIWPIVDGLPPEQAEVIRKEYKEGKQRARIAQELHISPEAVGERKRAAFVALRRGKNRKILEEYWKLEASSYKHTGFRSFSESFTSNTENMAMRLLELRKKYEDFDDVLKILKDEYGI